MMRWVGWAILIPASLVICGVIASGAIEQVEREVEAELARSPTASWQAGYYDKAGRFVVTAGWQWKAISNGFNIVALPPGMEVKAIGPMESEK